MRLGFLIQVCVCLNECMSVSEFLPFSETCWWQGEGKCWESWEADPGAHRRMGWQGREGATPLCPQEQCPCLAPDLGIVPATPSHLPGPG